MFFLFDTDLLQAGQQKFQTLVLIFRLIPMTQENLWSKIENQ